jgi:hypothetical protein
MSARDYSEQMTELTEPPLLVLACDEGIPSNLRAVNRSGRQNYFSAEWPQPEGRASARSKKQCFSQTCHLERD